MRDNKIRQLQNNKAGSHLPRRRNGRGVPARGDWEYLLILLLSVHFAKKFSIRCTNPSFHANGWDLPIVEITIARFFSSIFFFFFLVSVVDDLNVAIPSTLSRQEPRLALIWG